MFTAHSSWHSAALAGVLTGSLLGSSPAFAQTTHFEDAKPHVNVSVAP